MDVRQASALYRLLGDEARLRLLRVLDRERLNVDRAHRHPRPGAVRRVAPPRPAQGRRPGQRGEGRRLHLLPPGPGAQRERPSARSGPPSRSSSPPPADDTAVRADEARLQEVLRLRKENFESHVAADARDARQFVPGRSWAAWSRALGLLLPPLTIADLGCGEGYLTIEASRWAARVIAVDRSEVVLDRARALGPRRRVVERRLEARRAREAADQGRDRRRRPALAGAAPRREPGPRGRRGGADHGAGRPRAGARSARAS